jgi:hypothetical protein
MVICCDRLMIVQSRGSRWAVLQPIPSPSFASTPIHSSRRPSILASLLLVIRSHAHLPHLDTSRTPCTPHPALRASLRLASHYHGFRPRLDCSPTNRITHPALPFRSRPSSTHRGRNIPCHHFHRVSFLQGRFLACQIVMRRWKGSSQAEQPAQLAAVCLGGSAFLRPSNLPTNPREAYPIRRATAWLLSSDRQHEIILFD